MPYIWKTFEINKFDLLGEVSGTTKAMPSVEATRCAPDLIMKFSSVQVRPDSQ